MINSAIVLEADDLEKFRSELVSDFRDTLLEVMGNQVTEKPIGREQLSELLCVGVATIDRLVRDEAIPSLLVKSRRMFIPSKVFAALESSSGEKK